MDTVSEIFQTLRLTGGLFLDATFSAPWCISAKIGPEDCRPFLPQPRAIIAYHYVRSGRMLLHIEGQPAVGVEQGEIVILPRNDAHLLASELNLRPIRADDLIQAGEDGGLARIVHGGNGENTDILCGFLGSNTPHDPILGLLPAVLKLNVADSASGEWIESSFKFAARQFSLGRTESPAILAKLAELLFMEAVRHYLATLPADQIGWLDGLRDPLVARALALMHGRLSEPWTTEKLADEAGVSRSAFAAHFTRLMGEPPMRYLAKRRMQFACERLQESHAPVSRIAIDSGYESEPAFNRAFKRAFGTPPATWRKRQQARPLRRY